MRWILDTAVSLTFKYVVVRSLKVTPIFRYESAFFQDVVNGHDIVSWGAVDRSRPDGESEVDLFYVASYLKHFFEKGFMCMLRLLVIMLEREMFLGLLLHPGTTYLNLESKAIKYLHAFS